MTMFQVNTRRTRSFLSWLAVLLAPGLLIYVPILNIFAIPVWFVWTNIPAILFTVTGVRTYEFREFGVIPKGLTDWAFIVGFYIIAAFLGSRVASRNKAGVNKSPSRMPPPG